MERCIVTFSTSKVPAVSAVNDNNSAAFFKHPNGVLQLGNCITHMRAMPNACVDSIISDLPYGVGYTSRDNKTLMGDRDLSWVVPAAQEMYRVLKSNSYTVIFCGFTHVGTFHEAFSAAGFRIKEQLVFVKDYASNPNGKGCVSRRHETAYVLTKGYPKSLTTPFPSISDWGRYTMNKRHPTEKPLELMERLVEAFCPEGGVVLDPCCGSGTTAAAAIRLRRRSRAMDIDPMHFATAQTRLGAIKANCLKPIKRSRPVLRSQRTTLPQKVAA